MEITCRGSITVVVFSGKGSRKRILAIAVGAGVLVGGVAVVATPVVIGGALGALGFTAGGIADNSVAAGMMSSAANANGGGVVAWDVLAALPVQSVAAAGIAASTDSLFQSLQHAHAFFLHGLK